jgi:ribonuclease HI
MDIFRAQFDPTIPVFMETDGACSGNLRSGGWGYILAQQGVYTTCFGADPDMTNNEMELRAIEEGLKFFQNMAYVVIKSDS